MNDDSLFDEIFKLYKPLVVKPVIPYRAYYDNLTGKVIKANQEIDDLPFVEIDFHTFVEAAIQPDRFMVREGKIAKRSLDYPNRLQLKPNGSMFASIKGDMQFAVPLDWSGEKDYWDANS